MWDLPIYMGLVGSVAYVAYKLLYRMTGKEKLSASGRWILLRLVMAFYLLPFPLLSEPLKRMIRDLSDKDILFRKVNTGVRWEDVSKTFYIGNDGYMTFGKMATWKRNILITGIVVFLIYMLHFLKTYRECRRLAHRIPGQKPKNNLDDASSRIARKYHVTIKYVPEKCGSFTQGIRRPTVVIAQSEDEKATQYQTRHEMTHIRYHHTFWSHLAFLVNAVHFWNPLAYLFYQEVRQCIELHCDEQVCQSLTREECIEYGKRILDAAVQDSNTGVLNFRGKIRYHNMEERIKMIKRKPKTKKGILLAALLLMSAATAIPVLAYESPKVVYDEELEAGEVLTDVVFVPDGTELVNKPDWYVDGIPTGEIPFITTNAYFMDEGEDRLCRNREVREHNNCISYSHISEGWCELVDKRQNVLEKLIIEEAIGEFMDLLTDRQRQVIHQIYFQQRTQREVSRVFGITEPAVSKCISQAKQKMRRNAGRLIGVLQKGE